MITADNTFGAAFRGASIRAGVALCLIGLLSGCASEYRTKISTDFKEKPKVSQTNMSCAIACMANTLQGSKPTSAYVLLVRDVKDGTVKDSDLTDGPLSDAGRIMLLNTLSEHIFPHAGLVPDTFPFIYVANGREDVGLNRFGLPSPENMQQFLAIYEPIIQKARKKKNMPPASNIVPLVVSAQFSRFDADNAVQEGMAHNIGTRTKELADNEEDSRWRKFAGEASIGLTSSARLISLVINLIDPRNNLVVASQSFDLIFYRDNRTYRLRAALGEGYYGFSKDNIVVEGVHSAQKLLIDAGALWILNKAYGDQDRFATCFTPEEQQVTQSSVEMYQRKEAPPTVGTTK